MEKVATQRQVQEITLQVVVVVVRTLLIPVILALAG